MARPLLISNSTISALKHHWMIPLPFDHAKIVPKTPNIIINSQSNPLPKFQIDEYRTRKAKQINKALDDAVPLLMQHPPVAVLQEAMRYTMLAGGKRVFGTLGIASCELVGGNESVAMPLACAAEMLMTMAVLQDDLPCLDNDDFRRGKHANHKIFGEATTVLAFQALLCLAIEHIATKTKNVLPDRLLRAIVEICSALGSEGVAAGQIMDATSEGKELISLSELELIHTHKCGNFVEAIIVSGVVMGGGNEQEIKRLSKYGKCVGLAYQVRDDIIDAIGSPEEMGKKSGRDMLRDKATYPKLMGIDGANKYAMELLAQANQELAHFDPQRAAPLYHMADFVVSRQY